VASSWILFFSYQVQLFNCASRGVEEQSDHVSWSPKTRFTYSKFTIQIYENTKIN